MCPIYEFKCNICHTVTEEILSIDKRDDVLFCEVCEGVPPVVLVRQTTAPATHFKGSGFYETDYKHKE